MRMKRTAMGSSISSPKRARKASVSAPCSMSMFTISMTWSSCWRLRLPASWLRRSVMSAGVSGTVLFCVGLTWMTQISSGKGLPPM